MNGRNIRRWGAAAAGLLAAGALAGCYRKVEQTLVVRVPQMTNETARHLIVGVLTPMTGEMGIRDIQADLAARTVTVMFNSEKLAIKNIEVAIAEAGFDANDLPAVRPPPPAETPAPAAP